MTENLLYYQIKCIIHWVFQGLLGLIVDSTSLFFLFEVKCRKCNSHLGEGEDQIPKFPFLLWIEQHNVIFFIMFFLYSFNVDRRQNCMAVVVLL